MKDTEKATIIFIALVSALTAYLLASSVIGKPNSTSKKVDIIDEYSSSIQKPDDTIFNKDAINPTVPVYIGGN